MLLAIQDLVTLQREEVIDSYYLAVLVGNLEDLAYVISTPI